MPKKLLLVEDDSDIRTFYVTFLRSHGYDVVTALDGEEGWEKFSKSSKSFDCILLDIMLPKLDGIEFLKRKAADKALQAIPVVMMTNVGSDDLVKKCYELGAKYFILKAEIDPQKIPEILEQAIDGK